MGTAAGTSALIRSASWSEYGVSTSTPASLIPHELEDRRAEQRIGNHLEPARPRSGRGEDRRVHELLPVEPDRPHELVVHPELDARAQLREQRQLQASPLALPDLHHARLVHVAVLAHARADPAD